jgi:hypothetical protein
MGIGGNSFLPPFFLPFAVFAKPLRPLRMAFTDPASSFLVPMR